MLLLVFVSERSLADIISISGLFGLKDEIGGMLLFLR